jgi:hypothetical protein
MISPSLGGAFILEFGLRILDLFKSAIQNPNSKIELGVAYGTGFYSPLVPQETPFCTAN